MKMLNPAKLVLGALLTLLCLAASSSVPAQAQAGGWQLDHYEVSGADDYTITFSGVKVHHPWASGNNTFAVSKNGYGNKPCQSVGTMSAIFVWKGSGQAPDKVSVLFTPVVDAGGPPVGPDPDDGFQDAPTLNNGVTNESQGRHIVQISNPSHNTTVKTDVYSLSAICGPSGGWTYGCFAATVVNGGNVQAWSTHCAPALNGSDPNFNPTSPAYFSGTGCQATGNAVALSGKVSHAQLCIGENGGDTVVKEYWDSSQAGAPNPLPPDHSVSVGSQLGSVNLSALFDSTHFKDQTKIKITLKVWDTNGGQYDVKLEAPAYNKAYIMENDTPTVQSGDPGFLFGGVTDSITRNLENIGYDTQLSSKTDTEKDMLNKFPKATVYYADTHTSDTGIGDCYNLGIIGGSGLPGTTGGVDYSELPPIIAKKNIYSGPYASASMPPYNLVFIDGCHSAGQFGSKGDNSTTGGAGSFGIYAPGNDRAFLGWTNFVSLWPWPINDGTGFTETLFANLAADYDLYTACTLSIADSPRIGWLGDNPLGVDKFNTGPLSPHIIGDPKMKMHGVYGDVILGYLLDAHGKETTAYNRYAWSKPL